MTEAFNVRPDFGLEHARWITRPVASHREWERIAVEATVVIESGGAALLFGVRDERNYYGIELIAEQDAAILFAMEDGVRRELARAGTAAMTASPAAVFVRIERGGELCSLYLNERKALSVPAPSLKPGTIGFRTGPGQTAVIRKLRVFDEDGRALYVNRFYDPSAVQFSAGNVDSSGSGLRLGENTLSICESPVPVDSPLFRKSFELEGEVVSAVASVYALGWYELRLNGRKADARVLAPANSPYERRLLYDTYDVTSAVRQGGNAIGLWLGNGYNLNYSRWGWKWKRDKAVIASLEIRLADGRVERIVTDETWQTSDSALLLNDIYDGETYDARRETIGWDTFGFEAESWRPASLAVPPEGRLEPNSQPSVLAWEALAPVRVLHPDAGVAVYDFGQNIAGWAKIKANGPAGSRVALRYSELIDEKGNIDPWTNRNAAATDVYVLSGSGTESYEPRFTYHGFRYVEVSGDAELLGIQAVPIHANVRETGRFSCSDELLTRLQGNIRWSFLNNLVSIPTDCCQRDERTPCLMDSAVVEEAAIHNFDMRLYYRKWLGDIDDSLTNPDWSGDKVTLPWHLYWYYGDVEALERHYEAMSSYIDHLAEKWPEGIVEEGFGDWCPPNEDGWENYFGEVAIVNTSLYYHQASVVSKAAGVLGRREDEAKYARHAESVRQAFLKRFYLGEGVFGSGSQTAQLMPLAYGMVPDSEKEAAFGRLVAAIEAKGGHLDTGIYGTRYLMDVLADHGRIDLAYAILKKEEYPGFGWQIAKGATTLWEQWSFKGGMHSHDHAMFGGIGASFYTRLGGIRPLAPGYERIEIRPYPPVGLEWAEARIDTVRGTIVSAWRREGGRLILDVEIPEGVSAVVHPPFGTADSPDSNGHGVEVWAGRYRF